MLGGSWNEDTGGPQPPFGPPQFTDLPTPAPERISVFAEYASLPKAARLYKSADATASNGAPPLPDIELPQTLANGWDQTENYLVMGTDRVPGAGDWRTDSLMVVGLDRTNGRAAILSIPRDFYVNIPGYGWGRINQADYLGELRGGNQGPELLAGVIEHYLGIPIDHWIRIHMDGFIPVVNALGGIDITLDTPFFDMWVSADGSRRTEMYLPAGVNHLDGQQAYLFSRLRYVGSDIGRASRQRAVIWALREKLLSGDTLTRLPELYAAFQQYVSTDLTIVDMLLLAQVAITLDQNEIRSGGIGLSDLRSYVTSNGAQVLLMNDPWRVRSVVERVWEEGAQTLANAFRGNMPGTVLAAPTPTTTVTGTITTTMPITSSDPVTATTAPNETVAPESAAPEDASPPVDASDESPAEGPTETPVAEPTEAPTETPTDAPAEIPTEPPGDTPEDPSQEESPTETPAAP